MYHSLNILHVDMDAFFASVEQAHYPQYKKKAIAVCNTESLRGVISASSYEAKKKGISSGMSVKLAKAKYPQLILVQAHYDLYQKISKQIMHLFYLFTPDYEQYSIDEAFLDVSHTKHLFKNQINIAHQIQKKIKKKFDITASIGIAENKLLAKFATELNKPNGITVLTRKRFLDISKNMKISKMPGIGKKTTEYLKNIGIVSFHDLRKLSFSYLQNAFGKYGSFLFNAARGISEEKIEKKEMAKSIGNEITLEEDSKNIKLLHSLLFSLVSKTTRRMRKSGQKTKTLHLKVRYFNFQTFSIQKTLKNWTDNENLIYKTLLELWNQIEIKPIRLIGVTLSNLKEKDKMQEQLQLFDTSSQQKDSKIDKLLDSLKDKFGEQSIIKGGSLYFKKKGKRSL